MTLEGSIVAWWDGSDLAFGCVVRDAGSRLNTVTAKGRLNRLQASKVAFRLRDPVSGPATPEGRVERASAAIARRAESVDVQALWELALDAQAASPLAELAELALGESTEASRCAVSLALAREGLLFERKGSLWRPRPREIVERRKLQGELERRSHRRRQAALDELVRAAKSGEAVRSDLPDVERYIESLEALATFDAEAAATDRSRAIEALKATGDGSSSADACRLLERLGHFADGENLAIRRYGLPGEFPPEVRQAASSAIGRADPFAGRDDLTFLDAFTIDGPRTREIDDALSWETLADGDRLWIHVADPGAYVEDGGLVDDEARRRGTTHYFPDVRLPMLPPVVGEDAASLLEGAPRPALSLRVDLEADGSVRDFRFVRSVVRCGKRWTYAEADQRIAATSPEDPTFRRLADLAERRQRRRVGAGAFVLELDALDIWLDSDRRVRVTREQRGSPAQRLVSESMVLAGELAARFAVDQRIPLIFRYQSSPEVAVPGAPVLEVEQAWSLRRRMPPARVAPAPGPHAGLGLNAYAQTTSPIRRYLDLFNQRQLTAALQDLPYEEDATVLSQIAARCASAEARARRAEAEVRRYWVLRHLSEQVDRPLPGTVVAGGQRPIVWIDDLCFDVVVPALAGAEAGQRVMLQVTRVIPREGAVRMRPATGSQLE